MAIANEGIKKEKQGKKMIQLGPEVAPQNITVTSSEIEMDMLEEDYHSEKKE